MALIRSFEFASVAERHGERRPRLRRQRRVQRQVGIQRRRGQPIRRQSSGPGRDWVSKLGLKPLRSWWSINSMIESIHEAQL